MLEYQWHNIKRNITVKISQCIFETTLSGRWNLDNSSVWVVLVDNKERKEQQRRRIKVVLFYIIAF